MTTGSSFSFFFSGALTKWKFRLLFMLVLFHVAYSFHRKADVYVGYSPCFSVLVLLLPDSQLLASLPFLPPLFRGIFQFYQQRVDLPSLEAEGHPQANLDPC